jgi:hypothetical protein
MPEIGDILDVTIEDLSPEQLQRLKDATDQFRLKCLMSFKKNRSGVPYLKNEMPRVQLSGEIDATTLQEKEDCIQAFWDSADVGDSPRGPLKTTGESPLKTRNKPKPNAPRLTTQGWAHATVALMTHQSGPLKDPLEQTPPRSRAHASLGRAPPCPRENASLERAPPRSRVRAALEQVPSRSRASHARTPDPVRGYGHLML